jgi:bacterioferritin (cytochrome b1)
VDTGVEKILVTGRDLRGMLAFTLSGDSLRGTGTPGHCVAMNSAHISAHDTEQYYLGMVTQEEELAPFEEHLLWCHACLDLVQGTENYVDTIQVGLLRTSER